MADFIPVNKIKCYDILLLTIRSCVRLSVANSALWWGRGGGQRICLECLRSWWPIKEHQVMEISPKSSATALPITCVRKVNEWMNEWILRTVRTVRFVQQTLGCSEIFKADARQFSETFRHYTVCEGAFPAQILAVYGCNRLAVNLGHWVVYCLLTRAFGCYA